MSAFTANGILVLLSDFGRADAYAAELHGVILARFPSARIVDATHEIAPGDIRSGAFVLSRIAPSFGAGTVFLAVVDPGVGTARRPVAAACAGRVFVGPDNGLLSFAAREGAEWRVLGRADLRRDPVSTTFHGRDVFAPAAAALASGAVLPADLGPVVPDPVVLSFPGWTAGPHRASGTVLHVDRFGNVVLSIPAGSLVPTPRDGATVRTGHGERMEPGTWGPYGGATGLSVHADSSGFVEVALPNGRADALLRASVGDPLEVSW